MAEIQINVNVKTRNLNGVPDFRALPDDHLFSRVPQIGELITLGNDSEGHEACYRVVLVLHMPTKPSKLDAVVYAERVDITKYLTSAAETSVPEDDADIVPRGTD